MLVENTLSLTGCIGGDEPFGLYGMGTENDLTSNEERRERQQLARWGQEAVAGVVGLNRFCLLFGTRGGGL